VPAPPYGSPQYPQELLDNPSELSLRPLFRYWAGQYGVPAGLLEALAWMESGWQSDVVSPTGAIGVGQIEPGTATFISEQILGLGYTLDPTDPNENIRMSAAYLSWMLGQTGDSVAETLGGYYQGLASLAAIGPYSDTRNYVEVIGELWWQFRSG
jgi:soluble lytic murein transglycosylase-like protein